jgi:hypothetical protein
MWSNDPHILSTIAIKTGCSVSRSYEQALELAGQEAGSAPDRFQHGDRWESLGNIT